MRNGLLTSLPHIPLTWSLLPRKYFMYISPSTSKPFSRLHPHYLSYCFFHYLYQSFLINEKDMTYFLLQPAIVRTTPRYALQWQSHPLVVVPSWPHKDYLGLSVLAKPEVVLKFPAHSWIFSPLLCREPLYIAGTTYSHQLSETPVFQVKPKSKA